MPGTLKTHQNDSGFMNRFIKTFLLGLILLAGCWLLYHRGQIQTFADAVLLVKQQIGATNIEIPNPFELVSSSEFAQSRPAPAERLVPPPKNRNAAAISQTPRPVIRIASFKLTSSKSGGDLERTADICQQFDVVALQNHSKVSMARLVNELNKRGMDFRFVDQAEQHQKFATIFNQQVVALEEQHWYTVNDPEDLFMFEPLVAWFRVLNAPPQDAFTFTLANVQLNEQQPDKELSYLGELFRSIRQDGRGEDDIILAGDFYSNDRQIKRLEGIGGLKPAIIGMSTNTRNDAQLDNLIFDPKATVEFTGETGVFDFMKRFNMTLEEALGLSNRMPVWAEFSVFEGHTPGRAAERLPLEAFGR